METKRHKDDEYSPKETERRARDLISRSFAMPYKPHKELVGTTERAKKMAEKKKARGPKPR